MTGRLALTGAVTAAVALGAIGAIGAAGQAQAQIQASAPRPPPATVGGGRWQALTADQRDILAPLEAEWPRLPTVSRQKWLALAGRYRALPPIERERISSRMQEWVRLSPEERGRTRLTFEEAKQVPLGRRQARWEQYQALSADERQRFEAEAAARHDAALRAARAGRAEPSPATTADGVRPKVNATPTQPAPGAVPLPVAPTVVRAGQGATTRSMGQTPVPPAHQQAGMPKIATTPELVNRATLLPRQGPQATAVASPKATAATAATAVTAGPSATAASQADARPAPPPRPSASQ